MQYDVSVTRTRHYDHIFRVEANTEEEAYDIGLEMAGQDNANNWCDDWEDLVVDGVHPVDAGAE